MSARLRVVIADDERPARSFLAAMLRSFDDVTVVAEAESGIEAVTAIDARTSRSGAAGPADARARRHRRGPHGEEVRPPTHRVRDRVRRVRRARVRGQRCRLPAEAGRTIATARGAQPGAGARRARGTRHRANRASHAAIVTYEASTRPTLLERIPVRKRDEILLVPVSSLSSIVAEGELLYLTTLKSERHTITYRLKDLESRLDPDGFVRLGRGTLVNLQHIVKVHVMPGVTHVAQLANGEKHQVSRLQSRVLRERLLRL